MFKRQAEVRRQQSGIRPEVVARVLDHGRRERRRGAEICVFDRLAPLRAKSALERDACARVADRPDG